MSRLDDGSFELDTDFFVRVLKAANTNVSTLDYIVLTLTNGTYVVMTSFIVAQLVHILLLVLKSEETCLKST